VSLQFDAEESAAVRKALQAYLSDLRMEIVDTDNPGFRRELRSERSVLEGVVAKLDQAAAGSERNAEGHATVHLAVLWTVEGGVG
jgi:hypothetical protein